jgi:hypothetical protein
LQNNQPVESLRLHFPPKHKKDHGN